jgi:hypothetical protein
MDGGMTMGSTLQNIVPNTGRWHSHSNILSGYRLKVIAVPNDALYSPNRVDVTSR